MEDNRNYEQTEVTTNEEAVNNDGSGLSLGSAAFGGAVTLVALGVGKIVKKKVIDPVGAKVISKIRKDDNEETEEVEKKSKRGKKNKNKSKKEDIETEEN